MDTLTNYSIIRSDVIVLELRELIQDAETLTRFGRVFNSVRRELSASAVLNALLTPETPRDESSGESSSEEVSD